MNMRHSFLMLLIMLCFAWTSACTSSDQEEIMDGDSESTPDGDSDENEQSETDTDEEALQPDGDSESEIPESETEEASDSDKEEENVETDSDDFETETENEPETEIENEVEAETETELEEEAEMEEDGDFEVEEEIEPEEEAPIEWFIPASPAGLLVVNFNGTDEISLSAVNIADGSLAGEAFVGNLSDLSPAVSLSLNLTLPSYPLPGNRMGVLDRENAVYTAFTTAKDYSVWQRNLMYDLNPQDMLVLSDGRAYVSRYETNLDDNPGVEWDSGDDIYIISWPEASPLGAIALGSYASNVGGVQCKAHPRRMAAAWNLIWVVLENTSADGAKWGDGKLLAIDPASDSVIYEHTISGRHNCTDLAYMEELDQLAVVCGGNPGDASPKTYSGVSGFEWDGSALSAGFSKPAEFISIGPLGERLAVYGEWVFVVVKPVSGVSYGETVWGVNGSNLGTISVFQTPQNGLIKSLLVEPGRGRLYFTDSSAKAVRQADLKHFPFSELNDQKIITDSAASMSPVELGLY